jgi:hypothetical protein
MDKPVACLHGEVKTPPFSKAARMEVGVLLRKLQRCERLSMPHSRPMPSNRFNNGKSLLAIEVFLL